MDEDPSEQDWAAWARSTESPGPGYWKASDGRWYPPASVEAPPPPDFQRHPGDVPMAPPSVIVQPARSGAATGCLAGLGAVVLIVVLLIIAITFLGSSSTSTSFRPVPQAAAPAGADPPTSTGPLPRVGDNVSNADGAALTLMSFGAIPQSDAGYEFKPGQVEAVVKLCAGKSGLSANPLDFSIVDSDNVRHEASLGATNNQFDSTDLAAGDCVKGGVGFTIPAGLTAKALIYDGGGRRASARFNLVP